MSQRTFKPHLFHPHVDENAVPSHFSVRNRGFKVDKVGGSPNTAPTFKISDTDQGDPNEGGMLSQEVKNMAEFRAVLANLNVRLINAAIPPHLVKMVSEDPSLVDPNPRILNLDIEGLSIRAIDIGNGFYKVIPNEEALKELTLKGRTLDPNKRALIKIDNVNTAPSAFVIGGKAESLDDLIALIRRIEGLRSHEGDNEDLAKLAVKVPALVLDKAIRKHASSVQSKKAIVGGRSITAEGELLKNGTNKNTLTFLNTKVIAEQKAAVIEALLLAFNLGFNIQTTAELTGLLYNQYVKNSRLNERDVEDDGGINKRFLQAWLRRNSREENFAESAAQALKGLMVYAKDAQNFPEELVPKLQGLAGNSATTGVPTNLEGIYEILLGVAAHQILEGMGENSKKGSSPVRPPYAVDPNPTEVFYRAPKLKLTQRGPREVLSLSREGREQVYSEYGPGEEEKAAVLVYPDTLGMSQDLEREWLSAMDLALQYGLVITGPESLMIKLKNMQKPSSSDADSGEFTRTETPSPGKPARSGMGSLLAANASVEDTARGILQAKTELALKSYSPVLMEQDRAEGMLRNLRRLELYHHQGAMDETIQEDVLKALTALLNKLTLQGKRNRVEGFEGTVVEGPSDLRIFTIRTQAFALQKELKEARGKNTPQAGLMAALSQVPLLGDFLGKVLGGPKK